MSVNLQKGQKISLDKEAGGALSRIVMGLGWDAIKKKGLFGFGAKTAGAMAIDAGRIRPLQPYTGLAGSLERLTRALYAAPENRFAGVCRRIASAGKCCRRSGQDACIKHQRKKKHKHKRCGSLHLCKNNSTEKYFHPCTTALSAAHPLSRPDRLHMRPRQLRSHG